MMLMMSGEELHPRRMLHYKDSVLASSRIILILPDRRIVGSSRASVGSTMIREDVAEDMMIRDDKVESQSRTIR